MMALEHAALKLAGEAVEKQEEKEQHDASPRCSYVVIQIVMLKVGSQGIFEAQFVSGSHEHANTNSYGEGDTIIILRIRLVSQELSHEHNGREFEGLEIEGSKFVSLSQNFRVAKHTLNNVVAGNETYRKASY